MIDFNFFMSVYVPCFFSWLLISFVFHYLFGFEIDNENEIEDDLTEEK